MHILQNGKFAVIGTYDGRCVFYTTENLKYHTQIHVRSSRGRNSQGRKITGIEPMPGEDKVNSKCSGYWSIFTDIYICVQILVSSNDSRIRLYDLRDLNLSCKYKGYVNISSQISASFRYKFIFLIKYLLNANTILVMMENTSQVDLKTRLYTFGAHTMSKLNSPRPEEIGIISGKESKV